MRWRGTPGRYEQYRQVMRVSFCATISSRVSISTPCLFQNAPMLKVMNQNVLFMDTTQAEVAEKLCYNMIYHALFRHMEQNEPGYDASLSSLS
jgi:hypothetical protein